MKSMKPRPPLPRNPTLPRNLIQIAPHPLLLRNPIPPRNLIQGVEGVTIAVTVIVYLLVFQSVLWKLLKDNLEEDYFEIMGLDSEDLIKIWRFTWLVIILISGIVSLSSSPETLGISTAIIGGFVVLVLQAPLKGILGWLMLITWKPFEEENYVKIGGIQGKVDNIALMSVILTETDEPKATAIHIPNSTLFYQEIIKYENSLSEGEVSEENGGSESGIEGKRAGGS